MATAGRSKLKTGKRPQQLFTKTLKEKEILFREGSMGRELFIIQEGKVGVFKESQEGPVELAIIEKNGIVGEMSLLDNQPRSATIRALEKTTVIVIDEKVFQAALQTAPVWLTSIVKIVVNRLRDINKRVDQTVLRDKSRGFVSLMLLLLDAHKYEYSSGLALDYNLVVIEAYYVCRLKKKESEKILFELEKRKILHLHKDAKETTHICFEDLDIIKLFFEYLTLKSQKKNFRELTIPQDAVNILGNIAYVAQKSGIESEEGTSLSKTVLLNDMSEKNTEKIESALLDLRRRSLINIIPDTHDCTIVFKKELLRRIKKIKEWLPRFTMEIT